MYKIYFFVELKGCKPMRMLQFLETQLYYTESQPEAKQGYNLGQGGAGPRLWPGHSMERGWVASTQVCFVERSTEVPFCFAIGDLVSEHTATVCTQQLKRTPVKSNESRPRPQYKRFVFNTLFMSHHRQKESSFFFLRRVKHAVLLKKCFGHTRGENTFWRNMHFALPLLELRLSPTYETVLSHYVKHVAQAHYLRAMLNTPWLLLELTYVQGK